MKQPSLKEIQSVVFCIDSLVTDTDELLLRFDGKLLYYRVKRKQQCLAGNVWYLMAPLVGVVGSFVSGSNTVSNIKFGAFQVNNAQEAGVFPPSILALQAVGGAAGNRIGIQNVVAALTTAGLLGREGSVIRENLPIVLLCAPEAGILAWVAASP